MKIAFVNKSPYLANTPSTVFSMLNAYGFALNNYETMTYFQASENFSNFESYFDIKKIDNFNIKTFPNKFGFIKSRKIFFRRVYKDILKTNPKYDVVITREPEFLPFLNLLKHKINSKIFYQSHNFYLDNKIIRKEDEPRIKKYTQLERKYINKLNGLLLLNNVQKELYTKYVTTPIFVKCPGIKEIHSPKDNFEKQIVLYIGSFQAVKGIETLLNAFATIKNTKARLVLVGGQNEEELENTNQLIKAFNLLEKVEVITWQSFSELGKIIANATIGVIPLIDCFYNKYLTAPSKLFEYMAYGIPIIASRFPSIEDFVKDGREALLIEPDNPFELAEAIDKILSSRKIYNSLTEQSNINAQKYLFTDTTKEMLNFIEKV